MELPSFQRLSPHAEAELGLSDYDANQLMTKVTSDFFEAAGSPWW